MGEVAGLGGSPPPPPRWWTEGQLRNLLGLVTHLVDLSGPRSPDPKDPAPTWTSSFVVGRSRGAVNGRITRHLDPGEAVLAMEGRDGAVIEGTVHGVDEVRLALVGDEEGGTVHRLHVRSGRDVCTVELEVSSAWFDDGLGPREAVGLLVELFRRIQP